MTGEGNQRPRWREARRMAVVNQQEPKALEEAAELVDWYRCYWEIEMFFNVIKNGCKIEAL